MKARTAAAKRKGKKGRGRPRIEGVNRTPSGQISREREPADIVAIDARMRHMRITEQQARDQKAATYIGYLNLIGARDGISDDQYEALTRLLELRQSFLRAIKAPDAIHDNKVAGSAGDEISEAYERHCRMAVARWEDLKKEIQVEQNYSRQNLFAALDLCIVRSERWPHMIPAIRTVGNVAGRFLRGNETVAKRA